MSRIVYIYGLKNIGCDEYRYIGKTTRPNSRLKEHLREKVRKFSYHKLNWIKESLANNNEIILELLEEVNEDNWQEKEKYYIDYYKNLGHKLTNLLDGGVSPQIITYKLNYQEAKEIVKKLNITTTLEWRNKARLKELPIEIPKRPDLYYLDNGWVSWSDWLDVSIISNKNKKFLPYDNAKGIVDKLNLKSNNEWREYCKTNLKPKNIPSNPDIIYKKDGWVSWSDWLGYDEIKLKNKKDFIPYNKARDFVSKLGLKTHKDWVEYSKNSRPDNIPSNPWKIYDEWEGIKKFLNNE